MSRKTARKYLKSGKLPSQCQPERIGELDRIRSSGEPEVKEILKRSPLEAKAVFRIRFVSTAVKGVPARPVENAAAQDQAVEGRIRRSEGGSVPAEVSAGTSSAIGLHVYGAPHPIQGPVSPSGCTTSCWPARTGAMITLCFSESFESLSWGFRTRCGSWGRCPRRTLTDRSSRRQSRT